MSFVQKKFDQISSNGNMALVDCVIKIGGSALTVKSQFETLNPKCLQKCSQMVKQLLSDFLAQRGKAMRLVIVHGAGSFGHFQAKQYRITQGCRENSTTFPKTSTDQKSTTSATELEPLPSEIKEGISKTRFSVLTLHQHFIGALLQQGVPAVGISPFDSWETHTTYDSTTQTSQCVVVRHNATEVLKIVQSGLVPVLHGDCVFDSNIQQRVNILSGDLIVHTLAKEFHCTNVVFASNVKGIYTAPPETVSTAKLIPQILVNSSSFSNSRGISTLLGDLQFSQSSMDVTGGILGKIETAIQIVRDIPQARVVFCKAGASQCRYGCLGDEVKECTIMKVAGDV
jgi:isopentenyl phosphate kinase